MDLQKALLSIRSIGLPASLRTIRYTLLRDRLERQLRPHRKGRRALQPITPGLVLTTRLIPSGARFHFERADLEVIFLAPDLVRITWQIFPQTRNTKTPISYVEPTQGFANNYALARHRWPDVTDKWQADLEEMTFSSRAMQVIVQGDGGLIFRSLDGKILREELPPEYLDGVTTHRALLQPEEHIYGLGERTTALNRRGGNFRMWNSDPGGHYGIGKDPIYICVPVYLSLHSQGAYLAFYENAYPADFSFETTAEARFEGGLLRYYIIPGPLPRALERYTELTGRPELPPRWSLGYHQCRWGYKSDSDIRQVAAGFQANDMPISAIHLDIDYMDGFRVFTVNRQAFPNLKELAAEMEAKGIKLVAILDPGVKQDPQYEVYREGRKKGLFCKLPKGQVLHGLVWPGWAAFPDFTNPKTREWWGSYYLRLLEAGIAGFWHDMNEPTSFTAWGDMTLPLTTRHDFDGRGSDHREGHNLYALLMAQAGYEALRLHCPHRRPWLLTRSGWAGLQRYAWSWTADTETSWEALRMTIPEVLGLALSGLPFSGPDIGGFSGGPSAELYLRWFELAAFLPFFRTHSAIGTPPREPWVFGEPTTHIVRDFLRLRYRLMPYLYTLAWQTSQAGHPLVRPLFWADMADRRLWDVDDAFLLGESLLIAPVVEQGQLSRRVTLPQGHWYNFWDDTLYTGPGEPEIPAPLEQIPVLVRAGSVLPLAEGECLTLHVFAPPKGVTPAIPPATLFSDSGDGYGPSRVDHFHLRPTPSGFELTCQSEGEYPFPYKTVMLQWHGVTVRQAQVDGVETQVTDNCFEGGPFSRIEVTI